MRLKKAKIVWILILAQAMVIGQQSARAQYAVTDAVTEGQSTISAAENTATAASTLVSATQNLLMAPNIDQMRLDHEGEELVSSMLALALQAANFMGTLQKAPSIASVSASPGSYAGSVVLPNGQTAALTTSYVPTVLSPLASYQTNALSNLIGSVSNLVANPSSVSSYFGAANSAANLALGLTKQVGVYRPAAAQILNLAGGNITGGNGDGGSGTAFTVGQATMVGDGIFMRPYAGTLDDAYASLANSSNPANVLTYYMTASADYNPIAGVVKGVGKDTAAIMNDVASGGAYTANGGTANPSNPYSTFAQDVGTNLIQAIQSTPPGKQVQLPTTTNADGTTVVVQGSAVSASQSIIQPLFPATTTPTTPAPGTTGSVMVLDRGEADGQGVTNTYAANVPMVAAIGLPANQQTTYSQGMNALFQQLAQNQAEQGQGTAMLNQLQTMLGVLSKLVQAVQGLVNTLQAFQISGIGAVVPIKPLELPHFSLKELNDALQKIESEIAKMQQFLGETQMKMNEVAGAGIGIGAQIANQEAAAQAALQTGSGALLNSSVIAGENDGGGTNGTTTDATANLSMNGGSLDVYSTAYGADESYSPDPDSQSGETSTGVPLAPGVVAVNPSIIPYGTQFEVTNNSALNAAEIAQGAPVDSNTGLAVFTAADTGTAVVNETASKGTTPVIDFASGAGAANYQQIANVTGANTQIQIVSSGGG